MSFSSSLQRERGPSSFSIFKFQIQDNVFIRLTDAEQPITFEGEVYSPDQVGYSDIVNDGTIKKASITITLPRYSPIVKAFRVEPPSFVSTVEIWEVNFSDSEQQFLKTWEGKILNCRVTASESEISCSPSSTRLSRPGLSVNYQKPCPYVVYGPGCTAEKVYQSCTFVKEEDGLVYVTYPADPGNGTLNVPSVFEGGLASWEDPDGNVVRATILRSVVSALGVSLRLARASSIGYAPSSMTLLRGCTHSEYSCINLHNNILNFGGAAFIPDDVPVGKMTTFY